MSHSLGDDSVSESPGLEGWEHLWVHLEWRTSACWGISFQWSESLQEEEIQQFAPSFFCFFNQTWLNLHECTIKFASLDTMGAVCHCRDNRPPGRATWKITTVGLLVNLFFILWDYKWIIYKYCVTVIELCFWKSNTLNREKGSVWLSCLSEWRKSLPQPLPRSVHSKTICCCCFQVLTVCIIIQSTCREGKKS